jgi:glycosyltransferase involved in cell wall biosynthesis
MLGFDMTASIKKRIKNYEKRLIDQVNIVIASSDYLRKTLIKRYNILKPIEVINNAIFLHIQQGENHSLPDQFAELFKDKSTKKIVYIGTISKWFDFDLILESLKQNDKIEYLLFGPCELEIPLHTRIKSLGAIEHKYVLSIMQNADCLVMPFIVTELIKSVNPVKAYEYIYACKPTVLPAYEETEKFEKFVYLYHSSNEYFQLLNSLTSTSLPIKCSKDEHCNFALINTWEKRIEEINKLFIKHEENE